MVGPSLQELADDAERRLPAKKFLHALGVTHAVTALAFRHGLDPDRAAAAGLLHDRSKAEPPAALEAELAAWGSPIEPVDRPFPGLWHAHHAAEAALRDRRWEDPEAAREIAEAVRYHSTGEAELGPLGKALFIADVIEPTRAFPGVEALRRAALGSLEAAYRQCLVEKCRHYAAQGRSLSPRALRALAACGLTLNA